MTPEEFKAKFSGRLTNNFLDEADKVLATDALDGTQRTEVQRALEARDVKRVYKAMQDPREVLALTMAETRLDEISADDNVTISTELDELL